MVMMRTVLVCVTVLLAVSQVSAKNWALLIAGSNTWDNYRHQADVCHAYQTMHKAGIPDDQMVVMMYDDIAYHKKNPYKGNIINEPRGPNVYENVLKDYTGKDVNVQTFLAVLQGDKDGVKRLTGKAGKVIESGPDDYVFVYFADHGAAGLLMMPKLPYLKATDLNAAFKDMHSKKKFKKLLMYTEACDSGSMFLNIMPTNIDVYVTTATKPDEPSWSQDYDNKRKTSINDEYSSIWLEDTDKANLAKETIDAQYKKVKKNADGQHPMVFGDLTIGQLTLDQFFGNKNAPKTKNYGLHDVINMHIKEDKPKQITCPGGSVKCKEDETCCATKSDQNAGYWCCPSKNATCCDDGVSCCDHGYKCDKKTPTCSKGWDIIQRKMTYPKEPSTVVPGSRSENDRVKVFVAKQRILNAESAEEKLSAQKELAELEEQMVQTQDLIFNVAKNVHSDLSIKAVYEKVVKTHESINNFECYYGVLDTIMEICPGMDITKNDFAARELYILVNLCNHNNAETIIEAASVASAKSPLCKL